MEARVTGIWDLPDQPLLHATCLCLLFMGVMVKVLFVYLHSTFKYCETFLIIYKYKHKMHNKIISSYSTNIHYQLPVMLTIKQILFYALGIYILKKKIYPCQVIYLYRSFTGFPGGASDKEPTSQCRRCKRCGLSPWVGKIPWRRKWQLTPVFFPGETTWTRNLVVHSP